MCQMMLFLIVFVSLFIVDVFKVFSGTSGPIADQLKALLDAVEITMRRKVGEQNTLYGSATNSDVADELEKKGFQIEKRKIHMDDHIKQVGEFEIPVRLFKDVTVVVKLKVEPEIEE